MHFINIIYLNNMLIYNIIFTIYMSILIMFKIQIPNNIDMPMIDFQCT